MTTSMTDFECNMNLTAQNAGQTEWKPGKPEFFEVGGRITFTSTVGTWSVVFTDSPFQPSAVQESFSGPKDRIVGGRLLREGHFHFHCGLQVGNKPVDWPNGKNDSIVKKKP